MQQRNRSGVLRTDGAALTAGRDTMTGKKQRNASGTAGGILWKGTERDEGNQQ